MKEGQALQGSPYVEQIEKYASSLKQLSHTFLELEAHKEEFSGADIDGMFDRVKERVCKKCEKNAWCWGENFVHTYQMGYDVLSVASWRENKFSGFLAQGIGTSMLQIPNIVRRPLIWLPVILSSAVLGPIGTMLLHMTNNATGSGMGTAGLVGPLMTWQVMTQSEAGVIVLGKIILIQFILPAAVTLLISEFMRKKKWIRQGDMKLEL